MHGHKNAVDTREGEPEIDSSEAFRQAAAEHFGKPEKQSAQKGKCGGNAHDQMKVPGDEIVADHDCGKVLAREEQSGDAAREKERDEPEGEEHGGGQLNLGVPQSAEPTHEKNRGGQAQGG